MSISVSFRHRGDDESAGDESATEATDRVAHRRRNFDDLCGNQNVQDTFNMVQFERIRRERSSRPRDSERR